MSNENIALRAVNITKQFPETIANKNINFTLKKGEIHALLGENGAGKTTFMNILYGIYLPTDGEIFINGKSVDIKTPMDALKYGIGMIHQHFMLVDSLTVLENVILGMKNQGFVVDRKKIKKRLMEISNTYGLDIEPDKKVWKLSVGQQQKVEIVKVLLRGANIFILDEPTAVLRPQETGPLFEILRKLKKDGKSIVFITHKLDEVIAVSDKISVLRKGELIHTVDKSEVTKEDLAKMMVGRAVLFNFEKKENKNEENIINAENINVYAENGVRVVDDVSIDVKKGEILGIAGISGNGQQELVQAIAGLRKTVNGNIVFNNINITNKTPRFIANCGINYIPADRIGMGLASDLSCIDNAILRNYYKKPILSKCVINYKKAKEYTDRIVDEFNVAVADINRPIKLLSGGNMQKLLFARELYEDPMLLIASYPSRGLDLASTEFVRKQMVNIRNEGKSVILISEDLDEIISISDRIAVMYQGRLIGVVKSQDVDKNAIGLMMAGIRLEDID
jgi:ABC-type uncharacterized transport system ATPase subunit